MDKNIVKQFEGTKVGILYNDTGKKVYARGLIKSVSDNGIILETNKNIVAISLDSIKKVKIGKDELDERRE
ncbi:MAG: hypothetical protein KQA38_03835 [Candidatus Aenigmarchaeota archaeon]|nr:hypothetical protein [Candidatus Aenigmarchaeota archaeon]